jgi:hypothetical protein
MMNELKRICVKTAKLGFHRALPPELEGALKVRHPNMCVVNEIQSASFRSIVSSRRPA